MNAVLLLQNERISVTVHILCFVIRNHSVLWCSAKRKNYCSIMVAPTLSWLHVAQACISQTRGYEISACSSVSLLPLLVFESRGKLHH